jgi:hypothetical protein
VVVVQVRDVEVIGGAKSAGSSPSLRAGTRTRKYAGLNQGSQSSRPRSPRTSPRGRGTSPASLQPARRVPVSSVPLGRPRPVDSGEHVGTAGREVPSPPAPAGIARRSDAARSGRRGRRERPPGPFWRGDGR